MINEFLEQICKEPDKHTLHKAKLAIIDWIGYSIAGTFTKQADPFKNLQSEFPKGCLLYTSPSPRDLYRSRMPSSA